MIHLSARLSWNDNGWNGCVCQYPHLNAHCIVNQVIRDKRDDKTERDNAGKHLTELDNWVPPCSRDIGTYASKGYNLLHSDPLERGFLKPVAEQIPPYTCLPAPYRWMSEVNFRDICEAEGLSIRGPDKSDKEGGWIYEPDRQKALLNYFWGRLTEGQSLIFYYVNQGNPVDENATRLIVGVGRLSKIGPQLFFEGTDENGNLYPLWTRPVTQDYPNQGFRLPYQEYIQAGHDPQSIACYVPRNAIMTFSYVGEHVTDDMTVGILERLIQSVEKVEQEGKVSGPWGKYLKWLNDCLADVWHERGPFPGIGSVLQLLSFERGTAFQRLELKDFVRQNKDPWVYVRAILEGKISPPTKYRYGFVKAGKTWQLLSRIPIKLELLNTLVRFELTPEQVRRVCRTDEREQAGIEATVEDLIANPYLICENDLGSATSVPINFNDPL